MGFFNDKVVAALESGDYFCSQCGALMEFEDEKWQDTLICPKCGHAIDYERYGFEDDDEYDALFPTREEVVWYDEDDEEDEDDEDDDDEDTGERYREVGDELGD